MLNVFIYSNKRIYAYAYTRDKPFADERQLLVTSREQWWYESGTGIFTVRYKARISRPMELAVPIHHGGNGEAAGEGSCL